MLSPVKSLISGDFSADVSGEVGLLLVAQLFRYALSGEVSNESAVVCPASSTSSFYFVGKPFFTTLKQKRDFFFLLGSKKDRELGVWEIKSPGIPSTIQK
jgi:hypothetical protein